MEKLFLHFVETSVFTKQIDKYGSMELLEAIQAELQKNPECGEIIQGTNGARKARIGDRKKNQGRSGAYRYIYTYFVHAGTIYLLYLYAKNEQSTLTDKQKKELANLITNKRRELGEMKK